MSELILSHPTPSFKKLPTKATPKSNTPVNTNPDRYFKIPSIVIHPDSLVLYSKLEYYEGNFPNRSSSHLSCVSKSHHNVLSSQATRKLKKSIKYLIFLAHDKKVYNTSTKKSFNYKVGFVTLTLASKQVHKDSFITSELLHQFLVEAKQKWRVTRYVWKAEYQRNGNIHYHILVDKFIPYQELRNVWNRIQNKHGYIDRAIYKDSAYSYNSTDIHSLYNLKDVTNYVTKYMSKCLYRETAYMQRKDFNLQCYNYEEIASLTNQNILGVCVNDNAPTYYFRQSLRNQRKALHSVSAGAKEFLKSQIDRFRIWGCSVELSNIKGFQNCIEQEYREELDRLRIDTNCKVFDSDYYSVFYFKNGYISQKEYPNLYKHFTTYILQEFPQYTTQLIFDPFT
jgi:hypothetical protein